MTGRPSDYNQDIADIICDLVATSTDGLQKICRLNPDLPDHTTITRWRIKHEAFRTQYAQAKREQAELLAQEIIDISDDSTGDTLTDKDGNERMNGEWVARSRLRVDSRKWVASKLLPKVYGDKLTETDSAAKTLIEKLLEKL
jgi:hypothetical protein